MQVIFLHHSSFLIEVDDRVLIFDFFNGDRVKGFDFRGKVPDYEPDTKIYLFSSHSHQDHYDMDVLRWADKYSNIKYIFSRDIRISPNFLAKHDIDPKVSNQVTFVIPGKKYQVDDIEIQTLRSTDTGVAFYITFNGISIFHAGDLNDWYMDGAGDLINGRMSKNYHKEIDKLKKLPINLAFVPMDPRLGPDMERGIDYFVRNTDAEYIFPMHMWQNYSGISTYKKKISNLGMADRIMEISRENQVFPFGD